MTGETRLVAPERRSDDAGDTALRPQLLSEFVGQAQARAWNGFALDAANVSAETARLIRLELKELS